MKINLIEYLQETVKDNYNKIAIEDSEGFFLFKDLDEFSNKIADYIILNENISRQPVAVFMPKNRWSVISFVGVFKSGNFYVPLDVKSPGERIVKILETLEASIVITDESHKNKLVLLGFKGKVLVIEEVIKSSSEIDLLYLKIKTEKIIDLDPIYAIFTSGSTGTPKGVLISHRGVIDYIEWARETYAITNKEIIGNQAPFYFDNSTLDIYLMIVTGATLIIIPEDKFTFPIKLIEYVNYKNINFVFWVPSVLNNISSFDAFSTIKPISLNKVLFAGEAMPNKHLNYWRKNHPGALYSNLYGPTEITVDCTYYIVDREFNDDESLPIGRACKNTQVLIVSDEGKLVNKGGLGELCVRGSSLALGYYNDAKKTEYTFVQNPLHNLYPDVIYKTGDLGYENDHGEIIFVGRKDSQIKHMGYRIELGEIETAILGIDEVENVCVLYDDTQNQIVSFFISKKSNLEIRKELINILPKYMIPTKWFKQDFFTLNANGKTDRLILKNKINS